MSAFAFCRNAAHGICWKYQHTNPKFIFNVARTLNIAQRSPSERTQLRELSVLGSCKTYFTLNQTKQGNHNGMIPWTVCSQRSYMRKKTIKIPPTKPLHFDYSGDLEKELRPLDLTLPKSGFEDLQLLEEGDERVQQIFSLKFADGRALLDKRVKAILDEVQEHPADVQSYEVKIAKDTIGIRNQMKHVLARRKDKRSKCHLIEKIHARQKALRLLRERDTEKFNWICEKLQLEYIPVPQYNKKLSKRATRKKVAREKAIAIKKQRLLAFKESLDKQKAVFEERKAKELTEIEGMLKDLGIEKMESYEQVVQDLGLGEPYIKKKEKRKKRRNELLELKFKLYKDLPKFQRKF